MESQICYMTQKIKTVKKQQHNKHKEECSLFEGFKRETQQIRLHSMNYGMGGEQVQYVRRG